MLENLKWYLVKVGIQKYAPVGIMAAVAAFVSYMAAHAGLLEQYGVTCGTWPFIWPAGQEPTGQCILIELDTLSAKTIAELSAFVIMVIRAAQHHTTGEAGIAGGQRENEDPPKAA